MIPQCGISKASVLSIVVLNFDYKVPVKVSVIQYTTKRQSKVLIK